MNVTALCNATAHGWCNAIYRKQRSIPSLRLCWLSKRKQLNRVRMKYFMTKKKEKSSSHICLRFETVCVSCERVRHFKSQQSNGNVRMKRKKKKLYFPHRVRSVAHPLIRSIFLRLFQFLTHETHFWQITCCTHVHTHTHVTSAIDNQNINYTLGNRLYWQAGLAKSEGK